MLLAAVLLAGALAALGMAVCTGERAAAHDGGMSRAEVMRQVTALTAIGREMFSDPRLSGSGRQSCATCHSPAHAYGPPNALAVQPGGTDLAASGLRAVPSLMYKQTTPQFTLHFHESPDEGDESVDAGPTGGLTWDGRFDRGRDQALGPLLSPLEMANRDRASLAAVIEANYGDALRGALGSAMPSGPQGALAAGLMALETFQQDVAEFAPYTSKYDAVLAGTATLSAQEARGLALFNDPKKGNCAHCHPSTRRDGALPPFTDFGHVALGVPRNRAIPANRDADFFDLGLCGPERADLTDQTEYCGMFKAPTLRNVALRRVFFHNGIFHSLKEVMEFYVQRDTHAERWYPRDADGRVRKFDDLPSRFHDNINVEPPFDRRPGEAPALTDAEIADVIAFLGTLTDGYRAP